MCYARLNTLLLLFCPYYLCKWAEGDRSCACTGSATVDDDGCLLVSFLTLHNHIAAG